ncbi:RNA polymerase sigma factor [Chitinophaga tropicalis]|nr:sigma-70 family RNA polymerase sigma factor [Chitinophaga tropicalis]
MNYVDKELLSRLRLDDESAFAEIYRRYQPLLHLEAYFKLNQHEEAQDLVQEVFTSLWLRRRDIDISLSLKAYLLRSIHYQYSNIVRSRTSFRKCIAEHGTCTYTASVHPQLELKDLRTRLYKGIEHISASTCRLIVKKVLLDQWSYKEIQHEFNVTPANARNQVSRGLKELRSLFSAK